MSTQSKTQDTSWLALSPLTWCIITVVLFLMCLWLIIWREYPELAIVMLLWLGWQDITCAIRKFKEKDDMIWAGVCMLLGAVCALPILVALIVPIFK